MCECASVDTHVHVGVLACMITVYTRAHTFNSDVQLSTHTHTRTHTLQVSYNFEMCAMDVERASATNTNQEGLIVHGLYLEGCAWDANAGLLCESAPKVGLHRNRSEHMRTHTHTHIHTCAKCVA